MCDARRPHHNIIIQSGEKKKKEVFPYIIIFYSKSSFRWTRELLEFLTVENTIVKKKKKTEIATIRCGLVTKCWNNQIKNRTG